ncbi:amidohydrolase family protein [Acaryochloris sp. CCMEE 5410]|uniref:amidohydrolase family protein n=1 Tax=Acaryochloris sp. CCMEE 5410 TaxID=310037 RepID=UPI0021D00FBC|nr:amidohydrolase family protein [Acaryochloris sp. CCMEE 5410]
MTRFSLSHTSPILCLRPMHLLETCYQRQYAYRRWGKSFVQHLDEIGVLGPWLTCAHMVWVDEADLALLAERGVGIAHNPSSNLRLRSGIAPIAAMSQAGITLGIGLDGHGLDDDQDYLREMRLAWTLGNQPRASSPSLEAQTIWQMGTVGGRRITLGEDIPLGCLAKNEMADLVLVDWGAIQGMWLLPAPDGLLRRATRQHVKHVMVNGDWVIWDGQSSQINEGEIIARLQEQLGQQNIAELEGQAKDSRSLAHYLRSFYAEWDNQ